MRTLGIVVAVALGSAGCKGGGFGHAFSGLGHGLGHAVSGIGHAAGHAVGGAAHGVAKGATAVGRGLGHAAPVAGRIVGDVVEGAVDIAANAALEAPGAVIVVDGVDEGDPCRMQDGNEVTCDDGFTCVPNGAEAVCVPVAAPGAAPGATP
jgi:hypothetical protein